MRLPGVDHILAAQNESLPPVRKPHGYPVQHPSATAYNYAQLAQAHAPIHYGYTHASIEALTPPAAFSSPRGMYADNASDTSSDSSSGSRESSTCPPGSISSTTAWSTRAKRGSESQGSGSERRSIKRPDSSKGELWCTDCECAVAECTSPKVHKARVKKIVKEKSSRSTQASILQSHEDLTQNALNFNGYKIQQPGNKKKSGMEYDKKEILASSQIFMDEALQTIAGSGEKAFHEFLSRLGGRVQHHITHGSATELPANSLLSGPDGEGRCLHEINKTKCDTPIECRKSCRSENYNNNIRRIIRSAPRSPSQQSWAGSRSSSSTPRRR